MSGAPPGKEAAVELTSGQARYLLAVYMAVLSEIVSWTVYDGQLKLSACFEYNAGDILPNQLRNTS